MEFPAQRFQPGQIGLGQADPPRIPETDANLERRCEVPATLLDRADRDGEAAKPTEGLRLPTFIAKRIELGERSLKVTSRPNRIAENPQHGASVCTSACCRDGRCHVPERAERLFEQESMSPGRGLEDDKLADVEEINGRGLVV